MPVGVEFDLIDQGRPDHINPPNLIVISGTMARVRIHRNGPAGAERRKRSIDVNVVAGMTVGVASVIPGWPTAGGKTSVKFPAACSAVGNVCVDDPAGPPGINPR